MILNTLQSSKAADNLAKKGADALPVLPVLAGLLGKIANPVLFDKGRIEAARAYIRALAKIAPSDASVLDLIGRHTAYRARRDPKNHSFAVRDSARTVLYELGRDTPMLRKRVVPFLLTAFKESKAHFKEMAKTCEQLSNYGKDAKAAVGTLTKLKFHPDPQLREAARKSIVRIGGMQESRRTPSSVIGSRSRRWLLTSG